MGLPNLRGSNIQDTFQRVLQTDNGTLRDGTGSLVTLTNITASGNISASGDLSIKGFPSVSASLATAGGGIITGVTAGTGLSGGGTVGSVTLNVDATISTLAQLNASSSALQTNIDAKVSNSSTASFAITGSDVIFANIIALGNISASSNISSSGTITATSFIGNMDGGSF